MQLGVIPARYESQRFPGKPLVDILGKPMVVRTWEQVNHASLMHGLCKLLKIVRQKVEAFGTRQKKREGIDSDLNHLQPSSQKLLMGGIAIRLRMLHGYEVKRRISA